MTAFVCDICGGKLVICGGGVAVCDNCGMEHSIERMREKVQAANRIVPINNSHLTENYLEIAESARNAENNAEAEAYCNKVLEIEPKNYRAWLLKGEAAAWQSSVQNPRIDESGVAFIKAITYAPDDERDNLAEEVKENIKNLFFAMMSLRTERFEKWPDREEAIGFISDITSMLNIANTFLSQAGVRIPVEKLMVTSVLQINEAIIQAWQTIIWPEYNGDLEDWDYRPRKYEWKTFIERVDCCIDLLQEVLALCDEGEDTISCYENLIFMHQAAIDSCSWDYDDIDKWRKLWHQDWSLTDNAKNFRRDLIHEYKGKILAIKNEKAMKEAAERAEKERIKKEAAQKRFDIYWHEHAAERASLEAEVKFLDEQIIFLEKNMENIPGVAEKINIQKRIKELTAEKSTLGFFKGKQKKVIQEKLDSANIELKAISDRIETAIPEIEQKIEPLRIRYSEITSELTKER